MTDKTEVKDDLDEALAELTPREARAIRGLVEGKSKVKALQEAGYASSTALKQAKRVLGKPRVQTVLTAAMEDVGITTEMLVRVLAEGLDATKDEAQAPDHAIRHKFLMTSLQLRGELDRMIEESTETYEERILRIRGLGNGEN